jgi:hypothetical protein
MQLHELAHARTGDKGHLVNIALIAYRADDFALIEASVTAERVREHFRGLIDGPVERYSIPQLGALNFVLHRPENQGVTHSLALDAHGKCLGSALLMMEI